MSGFVLPQDLAKWAEFLHIVIHGNVNVFVAVDEWPPKNHVLLVLLTELLGPPPC